MAKPEEDHCPCKKQEKENDEYNAVMDSIGFTPTLEAHPTEQAERVRVDRLMHQERERIMNPLSISTTLPEKSDVEVSSDDENEVKRIKDKIGGFLSKGLERLGVTSLIKKCRCHTESTKNPVSGKGKQAESAISEESYDNCEVDVEDEEAGKNRLLDAEELKEVRKTRELKAWKAVKE